MLLVRFCFGAGEAGAYPNASAVIGRWIPAAKRTRAWGTVWMTSQIGAALSPLLVVPLQVHYGWRTSFFVFGVVGLAWSVTWYVWFRDSPHEKAGVTEEELRESGVARESEPHGIPWRKASRLFGTIVGRSGNYDLPFIPMIALLCVGALLWMQVDPTRELFPETLPAVFATAQ